MIVEFRTKDGVLTLKMTGRAATIFYNMARKSQYFTKEDKLFSNGFSTCYVVSVNSTVDVYTSCSTKIVYTFRAGDYLRIVV